MNDELLAMIEREVKSWPGLSKETGKGGWSQLAIARRYLPEEADQGFVKAELGRPSSELVLFTVRPDRWLTADFAEEDER